MAQCSSCGKELNEIQRFCPQCGTPAPVPEDPAAEAVEPAVDVVKTAADESAPPYAEAEEVAEASPVRACAACGAELEGAERYCGDCGAAVTDEGAAMPAPASEAQAIAVAAPASPTCAACGGEVGVSSAFCGHCGAALAASGAGASAATTRPAPGVGAAPSAPAAAPIRSGGSPAGGAPSSASSFLEKLDTNDRIIVGGGIAALIASFLPWFSFDYADYSMSAWSSGFYWAWFAVIVCAGLAVIVLLPALGVEPPGRSREAVRTPVAAAAILFVVLKFLTKPEGFGYGVGIFLCLAAAIAVTVGCYRREQEAKH